MVKFRLSGMGGQFWILAQEEGIFLVTVTTPSRDTMNRLRTESFGQCASKSFKTSLTALGLIAKAVNHDSPSGAHRETAPTSHMLGAEGNRKTDCIVSDEQTLRDQVAQLRLAGHESRRVKMSP